MPDLTVSAVIPVRNRADTIRGAVESIVSQSYLVNEIIIVDDASTDSTRDVLRDIADQHRHVRILWNETASGAAAARNRGVSASSGTWIAFLDSDDFWLPGKIMSQVEAIRSNPEAVGVFTGYSVVSDTARHDHPAPASITLRDLRRGNAVGTTSTAMVRRRAFDAVGGFDAGLPSCQDWDLWLRLARVGPLVTVPDVLVHFTEGGKNRISRNRDWVIAGHRRMFDLTRRDADSFVEGLQIRSSQAVRLSEIFQWDLGDSRSAWMQAARACLYWPDQHALKALRRATGKALGVR